MRIQFLEFLRITEGVNAATPSEANLHVWAETKKVEAAN
jgi:hypothetical protein